MDGADTLHVGDTSMTMLAESRVRRVLMANAISMLGSSVAPVALAFAVLGSGSGFAGLSVVLTLNAIPALLFLLLGGVLADRFSRSRLLVLGRCAAGVAQLCTAVIVLSGAAGTMNLALAGFASGAASTVIGPAAQAILRQVVSSVQQLPTVNTVNRLAGNIIRIVGPVVGGAAAAVWSPGWVLVFDAATFFLAALMVLKLDLPPATAQRVTGTWQALIDGAVEVRRRSWLAANIVFGSLLVLCWRVGYQLTGPGIMSQSDDGPARWGLVQGAFGLGMVVGGLVMLRWRPRRLVVVSILACGVLAAPLIALGARSPLVIVVAGAVAAGIGLGIGVICWSIALGQHISDDKQGRVYAFTSLGELSAVPFGYLAVGLAEHHVSLHVLAGVCAAGIVIAVVSNLFVRAVWSVVRIA